MTNDQIVLICSSIQGFERLNYQQIGEVWKILSMINNPSAKYNLKFFDNSKDVMLVFTSNKGFDYKFPILRGE